MATREEVALIVKLVDQISGPAKKVRDTVRGIGTEADRMGRKTDSAFSKIRTSLRPQAQGFGKIQTALKGTATGVATVGVNAGKSAKQVGQLQRVLQNVGQIGLGRVGLAGFAGVGAIATGVLALGGAVGLAVREFARLESAETGVTKTTSLTAKEVRQLSDNFRNLIVSGDIRATTNQLLGMAEVAGQLGVDGVRNLEKFAATGARLQIATTLGGEEAILSLARIIQLTTTSVEDIDRVGASLVTLGNKFKANEGEIVKRALDIARGISVFDVSAQQVLGLATAAAELGIRSELARTAVLRTFIAMAEAINEGGTELEKFATVSGKTTKQMKRDFESDAFAAFLDLLEGMKDTGSESSAVLKQLGLGSVELASVMPALSKGIDRVRESVKESTDGFEENTSLIEESAKRADETSAAWNRLGEAIKGTAVAGAEGAANLFASIADGAAVAVGSIGELVRAINAIDFEGGRPKVPARPAPGTAFFDPNELAGFAAGLAAVAEATIGEALKISFAGVGIAGGVDSSAIKSALSERLKQIQADADAREEAAKAALKAELLAEQLLARQIASIRTQTLRAKLDVLKRTTEGVRLAAQAEIAATRELVGQQGFTEAEFAQFVIQRRREMNEAIGKLQSDQTEAFRKQADERTKIADKEIKDQVDLFRKVAEARVKAQISAAEREDALRGRLQAVDIRAGVLTSEEAQLRTIQRRIQAREEEARILQKALDSNLTGLLERIEIDNRLKDINAEIAASMAEQAQTAREIAETPRTFGQGVRQGVFGGLGLGPEGQLPTQAQLGEDFGLTLAQDASSAFDNLFEGIISGSGSAADSFRDFAEDVLKEISKLIIKLLVLAAVKRFAGVPGGDTGGGIGTSSFPGLSEAAGASTGDRAAIIPVGDTRGGIKGRGGAQSIANAPAGGGDAASLGTANVFNVTINAIDSQSFADALRKNPVVFAEQTVRAVKSRVDVKQALRGINNV